MKFAIDLKEYIWNVAGGVDEGLLEFTGQESEPHNKLHCKRKSAIS